MRTVKDFIGKVLLFFLFVLLIGFADRKDEI